MIVAVALGVVIGLALGSLGGGGSILAVPVLVYIAGQSVGAATSTSLVAVGVASLIAAIGHSRAGHIRWGAAGAFVVTGIAGSWAGSELNGRVNGDVLLLAFSILVLIAAYRMLTACPSCTNAGEQIALAAEVENLERDLASVPVHEQPVITGEFASQPLVAKAVVEEVAPAKSPEERLTGTSILRVLLAGTIVGFLTGLFGVGGGFVIVPALTLVLGLSMRAAIATSLVVIVGNALVSLGFRGIDAVDWSVAVPFTIAMLIGSAAGSLIADRLPQKRSLQAFAVILVAVAIANGIAAGISLAS
ncbi:MAG: sulfite exporter TauE/SafE family protein [Microthrixaceae bacterium]